MRKHRLTFRAPAPGSRESWAGIDGQNVRIDIRWENGENRSHAGRLSRGALSLAPEVIVSGGTVVTRELQQRTSTIPIVFVNVGDPIGSGSGFAAWRSPAGNVNRGSRAG